MCAGPGWKSARRSSVVSIEARVAIWRSAAARHPFWADDRMLGEVIRVLTVAVALIDSEKSYPTPEGETHER